MQEVDDNISGARRVMIQMYRRAMATRHVACRSGFRQHEKQVGRTRPLYQGIGRRIFDGQSGTLMDFGPIIFIKR